MALNEAEEFRLLELEDKLKATPVTSPEWFGMKTEIDSLKRRKELVEKPVAPAAVPVTPAAPVEEKAPPAVTPSAPVQGSYGFAYGYQVPEKKEAQAPSMAPVMQKDTAAPLINILDQLIEKETVEGAELTEATKAWYQDDLDEIRQAKQKLMEEKEQLYQANLSEFERAKAATALAEVSEMLALNLVQLLAGIQGLKTGRDLVTGMTFRPKDWSREMEANRADLREKNRMLDEVTEGKLRIQKEQEQAITGARDEELKYGLEGIREKLRGLRQQRESAQRESFDIQRGNIQRRQEAEREKARQQGDILEQEMRLKAAEARGAEKEAGKAASIADKKAAEGRRALEKAKMQQQKEEKDWQEQLQGWAGKTSKVGGKSEAPSSADISSARGQIGAQLQQYGMAPDQIDNLFKEANKASGELVDMGSADVREWDAAGWKLISEALNQGRKQTQGRATALPRGFTGQVDEETGAWRILNAEGMVVSEGTGAPPFAL